MIVVVDSGSTKADWQFLTSEGKAELLNTRGFNPFLHPTEEIYQAVMEAFIGEVEFHEISEVHYYGAGCSDAYRCSIVEKALVQAFPKAKVLVEHDLLAAARATLANQPGIACILGTGSNSCSYDGTNVLDNVTNLGHILGDEGSGCHLGKALVTSYFYRELPAELVEKFEEAYTSNKRTILNNIYSEKPNVYLASFSRFMGENKEHPFIRNLVHKSFKEFISRHVLKYEGFTQYSVSFVGSIAHHFAAELGEELEAHGLTLGAVVQRPIDKLSAFHLNSENQPSLGDQ
ncbi:MAG: hypothetical protein AAFV95_04310 [Bacteroidota bacterium]